MEKDVDINCDVAGVGTSYTGRESRRHGRRFKPAAYPFHVPLWQGASASSCDSDNLRRMLGKIIGKSHDDTHNDDTDSNGRDTSKDEQAKNIIKNIHYANCMFRGKSV